MRKLFFSAVLCGLVSFAFGQNLTITGRVFKEFREKDTLYYVLKEETFSTKSFVLIGTDSVYRISIPLKKIKKGNIETIVFTQRINSSLTDEYACIQKINIGKALTTGKLDEKNPTIITDVLPFENCSTRMLWGANSDEQKFIGTHNLDNETIASITLNDMWKRSVVKYQNLSDNLITEEKGSWKYDMDRKQIKVYTYRQRNPEIGIIISKKKEYVFDVINENGTIKLELSK